MNTMIRKHTLRMFALVLSVMLVLAVVGTMCFTAEAATSTTTENGVIGTAFPSSFSAEPSGDYYIQTKAQLKYFLNASKSYTFANATVHLAADIDWGGSAGGNWTGIGKDATYSFCGTFDGHGYTISNLYSTTTGLFLIIGNSTYPATVKNFTLDNAVISGVEGKARYCDSVCES